VFVQHTERERRVSSRETAGYKTKVLSGSYFATVVPCVPTKLTNYSGKINFWIF
jgi:hypothetical protein